MAERPFIFIIIDAIESQPRLMTSLNATLQEHCYDTSLPSTKEHSHFTMKDCSESQPSIMNMLLIAYFINPFMTSNWTSTRCDELFQEKIIMCTFWTSFIQIFINISILYEVIFFLNNYRYFDLQEYPVMNGLTYFILNTRRILSNNFSNHFLNKG